MTIALAKKNPLLQVIPKPLYLLAFLYRKLSEKLICMSIKSFFLAFALSLSAIVTNAQFKKGMRMVGTSIGSILFNSGNSDITSPQVANSTASKNTNYNISITPSLGWFLSDQTAAGALLNINPSGDKTTYEQNGTTYKSDKSNRYNIGAGGFVRTYLGQPQNLRPFAQATINAGFSDLKTEGFYYYTAGSPTYKETYTGKSSGGFFLNATFLGGFTKMINEFTGLDFFVGYTFSKNNFSFKKTTLYYVSSTDTNPSTGIDNTTTKYTNNGFTLGVAFQIFLKEKKK